MTKRPESKSSSLPWAADDHRDGHPGAGPAVNDDGSSTTPRSPAARALTLVILSTTLIVGGVYLAIDRLHASAADAVEHPGPAATVEQTQSELVGHAKDIVAITGLRQPTAGYVLMSCRNRNDPPYQGAVYMNFQLPTDVSADQYLRSISTALIARGWREGPSPNQHLFSRNLSKDGVNAIFYPADDLKTGGVARIYGQCHDVSGSRGAQADWLDITDRVR